MSAPILQPGDQVIVEFPYITDLKGRLDIDETQTQARSMIQHLEASGIKVLDVVVLTGIDKPGFTAIIRGGR